MFSFLERISYVIVAGGYDSKAETDVSNFEVLTGDLLTGDLRMKKLPDLPRNIYDSSMVLERGKILLTVGNLKMGFGRSIALLMKKDIAIQL